MKRRSLCAIALLLLVFTASEILSLSQRQVGSLLEQSTVKVNTVFGNQVVTFGSGFFLTQEGLIGTNYHVIEMAVLKNGRILVEFQDKRGKREAQVYNWDRFHDFAILKIDTSGLDGIKALRPGSSEGMKALDTIYVAGFPVTGAFKAQMGELNSFQKLYGKNYIDISVPIDHGNSGGPVVDSQGGLVGISVAFMISARSMNLAIPVNDVKELIQKSAQGIRRQIVWDNREREPNDTRYQSNMIAQGLLIEGFMSGSDAADWYEIAGQEGFNPRITLSHSADNNFDFEVYSDDTLACRASGAGPQDAAQCHIPGRCFIKVVRAAGSGSYTLQISAQQRFQSDDGREQEPNNMRFTATLTRSLNLIGTLDASDDSDWFELVGQEGYNPTFILTHNLQSDFNFDVYTDDTLACSATGRGTPDRVSCSVPGRCFVRVWRRTGEGSYVIRIEGGQIIPPHADK